MNRKFKELTLGMAQSVPFDQLINADESAKAIAKTATRSGGIRAGLKIVGADVRSLIFLRGNAAFAKEIRASIPRPLQEKGFSKHVPRLFRVCIVSIALACFELLRLEQAAAALDDPGCDHTSRVRSGAAAHLSDAASARSSAAMPWPELVAKAGADYQGDGLAVIPTSDGARLRCVFQSLEGEAARKGLWLSSTICNAPNDRFRVAAAAVGRTPNVAQTSRLRVNGASLASLTIDGPEVQH
jgi:hypothetical protein